MYNCHYCGRTSARGQPLIRHTTFRDWVDDFGHARRDIASETPCCAGCKAKLDAGLRLARHVKPNGVKRPSLVVNPKPQKVQPVVPAVAFDVPAPQRVEF